MIKESNWDYGKCAWSKCEKIIPTKHGIVQMWSVYELAGSFCSKGCAVKAEQFMVQGVGV
jgi:hypothetical protein